MTETAATRKVVTHERPHLDEIFAYWLLKKYGEKLFPGVSSAQLTFVPNGLSPEIPEGAIALGIGGGMFDEHPTANGERKGAECASTLVVKFIGVHELPELQALLRLVTNDDLKGTNYPIDISALSKLMFDQGVPHEIVIEWVLAGIEAKYRAEYSLWQEARDAFESLASKSSFRADGRWFNLCVLEGNDNPSVVTYAKILTQGVVINRGSSGLTQIFAHQSLGISLARVAYFLRTAERVAKSMSGEKYPRLSVEEGTQEGNSVPGAEEWYYHPKIGLLNGSKTATAVPPTQLPTPLIIQCIKHGLSGESCS
jgi:hypothetical protein